MDKKDMKKDMKKEPAKKGGKKKASSWIVFVKAYAKKNNMKYNEALKKAGPEYKKSKASK